MIGQRNLIRKVAGRRSLSWARSATSKQDRKTQEKTEAFERNNAPVMNASNVAGGVLAASVAVALGSLYLVSQDGKEQLQSRQYMSVSDVELSRKFSTSGSAGAAVTVEAFSVGEQISPEALLLRYAFNEADLGQPLTKDDLEQITIQPTATTSNLTQVDSESQDESRKKSLPLRRKVDRRKQMQVIGKGAYGRVVRAVERTTGKPVAMKVVPHTAMSAEALLEEIEVLKRVRGHDNVIHLNEVLYCGGKYYVITELCEGGEILDHIISNGPFTEIGASKLINRVSSALQHIHKCGYVHLDIKPENLVFASKKSVDDCRIIDFGMARKISEVAGKLSMVRGDKGSRVGTMAYWSPEQVASVIGKDGRNLSDMDRTAVVSDPRACDMWALGVVLYIMLLGCHPFDPHGRGDEKEMAKAILKGSFRLDIHGDRLRLTKDAQDLIKGLLDPNPATRYTSNDVLEHPFIASVHENKKPSHIETLPTSWTLQGYTVNRDDEVDKLVENTKEPRLQPFATERTGEAFARALLMAVASNGKNVYLNERGDNEITSERLFLDAFNMFELTESQRLISPSVESLLRVTGDEAEDEVVVSYHRHHNEPVKPLVQQLYDAILPSSSSGKNPEEHVSGTAIRALPDGINFNEFKAFLRKLDCVTRYFKEGEIVFGQGSVPQGCYVLLNGEARLEYKDSSSSRAQYSYAKLPPGSVIGETAIIKGHKTRSSTVRCIKPSEVLFIPKDIFLRALAGSPALNEMLFKVAMKQQACRLHELVEYLNPNGLVVKHLSPGQVLFRQGERADYMYLIREGLVGSNTTAPSSRAHGAEAMSVKIAERGQGDLIGTSAATGGGGTRYSTAKCITPVTVVGIPLDELSRLRREEPVFRFYLDNLIQARKEFWQSQIADLERGVSEPQLLPLILEDDKGSEEETTRTSRSFESKQISNSEVTETESAATTPGGNAERYSWAASVLWYVNPYNWIYRSSDVDIVDQSGEERDDTDPAQQKQAEISNIVMTKHMKAFEEYAKAVSNMKHLKFKAGSYIFRKGEIPENFYIVDSGTVSVEYVSSSGKVLSVAQLGPGDHFGEQVLMEQLNEYVTTVRCVSDAEILAMDKKEFFALIGDGNTTFALAIRHAMRLRQHRWVRNLLKLAKEDKRNRRQEVAEKKRLDEIRRKKLRKDFADHLHLIERDEDENDENDHDFIDRDSLKERIQKYNSDIAANISGPDIDPVTGTAKAELGGVRRILLQPGESLFKKGDQVEAIYMVHRGELELVASNDHRKILRGQGDSSYADSRKKLLPGDTIGLEQIRTGATHSFAAVCSSPNTIVSKIPRETIDQLINSHEFVSQQLKRHARRTVPMHELERRAKVDLQKFSSYSTTMMKATRTSPPEGELPRTPPQKS